MKTCAFYLSMLFTAAMPTFLVLSDRPGSAVIIGVIGIFLVFAIRIRDIELFKGLGLEIRLKEAIKEANDATESLRKMAFLQAQLSKASSISNYLISGPKIDDVITLKAEVDKILSDLGFSIDAIKETDKEWDIGVSILYHSRIHRRTNNQYGLPKLPDGRDFFSELAKVSGWSGVDVEAIEALLIECDRYDEIFVYDDVLKGLVSDLENFQKTGVILNTKALFDTSDD